MRFHERRECGSNPVQLRFSERDTHYSNISVSMLFRLLLLELSFCKFELILYESGSKSTRDDNSSLVSFFVELLYFNAQ